MGSNISKTHDTAAITQKNDLNKDIGGNPDPRSPTPEITRTPLQNKPGSKHNITKNVDLRKTLENNKGEGKIIHNNPILSAVIKNHLQSFDPRSPTQEFERTPIVITSKTDDSNGDQKALRSVDSCGSPCLQNDITVNHNDEQSLVGSELVPKNLCNDFYDMSLNDSLKDEEPLGSSTASNEAIENNISRGTPKPTTLLETNFDYVENGIFEDSGEKSCENNALKQENDTSFSMINTESLKNIPVFKMLNIDPRSPSVGIDRTPIVVAKQDDNSIEENVEEMSDDLLIKVLQNSSSDSKQTISEHNNSDGILIYEDESNTLIDTPKKSKTSSNTGSRTPLSCMKNKTETSHGRSKSANTLFDPKQQKIISQIPKRASYIPRLKSLSKQNKLIPMGSSVSLKNSTVNGKCENTPPHSHRDKWDKDSSIVL